MGLTSSRSVESDVLIVGLDAAGKTTVLYKLAGKRDVETTIPTIGMTIERLSGRHHGMIAWDVGGRSQMRPLWRHFLQKVRGIVFVVDSSDRERMDVVQYELGRLLDEEQLKSQPLLVLANKQDLPSSMTHKELEKSLESLLTNSDRQWRVMPTCATKMTGVEEGFDWLYNAMQSTTSKGSVPSHLTNLRGLSSKLGFSWSA
eukprot:TRINITY_DN11023_c0_g1_i1.p1 TRINITY_DN11023_c0_g1~~TRINITY_DN11023_c0_g1_i1.p1  ORF type:complete len:202 (+),score=17.82 TRINITY_DN11023_c0_g1_i1:73-678(+)